MRSPRVIGRDGAISGFSHRGESADRAVASPAVVACPISWHGMAANGTFGPTAMMEIYRQAYEKALSDVRPSLYELAGRVGQN